MKRGLGTAFVLAAALALMVLLTLPAAAQEPKQGGRLIVATQQDPITMLGAVSTHLHSHMVADTMYSALVRQKWDDPKPYPDLAERWEISGDGKVYTFHLVKNATWHDGKPFTSADVKFSIEEVIRKNHPAGGIQIVRVAGDTYVEPKHLQRVVHGVQVARARVD